MHSEHGKGITITWSAGSRIISQKITVPQVSKGWDTLI